jgi:2-keto-3-deoxy-L-rhamnonate aldolase RhmA
MGIQVSDVDSAEEARAIGRAKFRRSAPRHLGQGMYTGYRAGGRHATEYAPWANANIIVCVSIDRSRPGECRGDRATEGIDMIAYGPPTSVRATISS